MYCNQQVQGGNLKHLMIDSSIATERLYFVIKKISDTEYHTYTMRDADLSYAYGTNIEVYKTVMVSENGEWKATVSFAGHATVVKPGVVSSAIDPDSFVPAVQ